MLRKRFELFKVAGHWDNIMVAKFEWNNQNIVVSHITLIHKYWYRILNKQNSAKSYAYLRRDAVRVRYESIRELTIQVWSVIIQQSNKVITPMAGYHGYLQLHFILFENARLFLFLWTNIVRDIFL